MRKYQKVVIWIGIGVSLICSLVMIYLFLFHKRPYVGVGYMLDTEAVGQYGDFMGGVVGTFLSVVLLFFTFSLQREDSDNNVQVYNNQQLNDEFFHLMDLYKDIVTQFHYVATENGGEYYEGKEALKKYVEVLNDEYPANLSMSFRRKKAIVVFQKFYSQNNELLSIYFRTLYRLCQIIDNSRCLDLKKVEYIKILRVQFTNAELFFIRYNAMNVFGVKFREYINKYNLLKHVQPLSLLEFKQWHEHLNSTNLSKANYTLQTLKRELRHSLEGKDEFFRGLSSTKRYYINVNVNSIKSSIEIILIRDNNISENSESIYSWMDVFTPEELEKLLFFFLYENLVVANFNSFNVRRQLKFNYNIITSDENKDIISVTVENKFSHPLVLSYKYV